MIFLEQQAKKSFITSFIFTVIVGGIVYISGKFLFQYLFPLVLASVIAWLVQKPAKFFSSKARFKTGTCAAFLSVLFYIVAALLLFFLIYRFALLFKNLLHELPEFLNFFENSVLKIKNSFSSLLGGISEELESEVNNIAAEMLNGIRQRLTSGFSGIAASTAGKLPSFLFSGIVTLVAGCYIAKDFEGLAKFFHELLGANIYGNIIKVKDIFINSVLKIIKGYLILMALTFIQLTVGFLIMGISYAPLIALLVSFIDLLPVFGTGTVLIPWSIAELILGNTAQGFGILAIYLTVTVVRNFAEPKIIGNQIGINPLFTLVAMFAGLKIFGFWGLFILPVALIVIVKYYKNEMELEKENTV